MLAATVFGLPTNKHRGFQFLLTHSKSGTLSPVQNLPVSSVTLDVKPQLWAMVLRSPWTLALASFCNIVSHASGPPGYTDLSGRLPDHAFFPSEALCLEWFPLGLPRTDSSGLRVY